MQLGMAFRLLLIITFLVCAVLTVSIFNTVLRPHAMHVLPWVLSFRGTYYRWNKFSIRLTCIVFVRLHTERITLWHIRQLAVLRQCGPNGGRF